MKLTRSRALVFTCIALAFPSLQVFAAESGRYGSPLTFMPYDQEVRLQSDTKSVTVRRLDVVRFVTADGRDFYWRFDTERPDVFPLAGIAPSGIAVPANATVYVLPEIPIAP
jgi:hypothetical protein